MTDVAHVERIEALYDALADAINTVRDGRPDDQAQDCETQFLTKLCFLALREVDDVQKQREFMAIAALNLGLQYHSRRPSP